MVSLTERQLGLLTRARRAVLGTATADCGPRLVPIAFAPAFDGDELIVYSALDEKPKSVADPRHLARVRDIRARPRVSVLVDEWHEQWSRLAWLRLDGNASLLEPAGTDADEHANAVALLRARYAQYASQRLEDRPIVRVVVDHVAGWAAAQ